MEWTKLRPGDYSTEGIDPLLVQVGQLGEAARADVDDAHVAHVGRVPHVGPAAAHDGHVGGVDGRAAVPLHDEGKAPSWAVAAV